MLKRLSRSKTAASILSWLLYHWVQLVWKTGRFVYDETAANDQILKHHPQIAATWHGQFLLVVKTNPEKRPAPVTVMASRSAEGEMAAQLMHRFGCNTVRGAGAQGRRKKDYGGVAALRGAVRALEQGHSIVMTADVPPGPARRTGEGIVTLACLSGRPVTPVAVATKWFIPTSSWSRFTINLPFSKLAAVVGDPIFVPRRASPADMEAARQAIESSLNEATQRAYKMVGAKDPLGSAPRSHAGLSFYRGLTHAAQPFAPALLRVRQWQGKEHASRRNERYGIARTPRPDGFLIWFHAASVGETNAVLPIIDALSASHPEARILLTTGTVTSAGLAGSRLPPGAIHQYVPLDSPTFVTRFFDHWRPDLAIFAESEIWPNLIMTARARGIPLVLVNARMTRATFDRWRKRPGVSRALFSGFDLVLAQNGKLAERFRRLGAPTVEAAGNLKFDAPRPPADEARKSALEAAIGERPVFLAASTHPGEDEMVAEAHQIIAREVPDLLTLVVPRHPARGRQIETAMQARGLTAALRSAGAMPEAGTAIYIADTIGELGIFYAIAVIAFIGGSLVRHGGQNPVEAIKWRTVVLTGPHRKNFQDAYDSLIENGGCRQVTDAAELARETGALLRDETARRKLMARAEQTVGSMGGALETTLRAIAHRMPPKQAPRKERARHAS